MGTEPIWITDELVLDLNAASIVDEAVKALQPFAPADSEQAANMLLFWRRRGEMTDADVAEVCKRMFPRPAPSITYLTLVGMMALIGWGTSAYAYLANS